MLLRRVIQHVSAQNWTTVAIDFAIVVIGVFIGIQVSNWNSRAAESRLTERQLEALTEELVENRSRLTQFQDLLLERVEAVNEIRSSLQRFPAAVELPELDKMLLLAVSVPEYRPELIAFQELGASGGLRKLAGTKLRAQISAWESGVRRIARLDRDALSHRDGMILPYMLSAVSIGSMASANPKTLELGLAPSQFRTEPGELAVNREFDNALSMRFIILTEELGASDQLREQTDRLIRKLQDR
jgi:hypothetical protein